VVLLPIALYIDREFLSRQDPLGMRNLTLSDWLHEEQRKPQLEADVAIIFRINEETRRITDDLIAGRLSLRAAAEATRAVRESKPARLYVPADDPPPEQSVEEFFVRKAFRGAEITLGMMDDPHRDAILARLQAELDDYLYAQAVRP
jgi:hypothetical protein